LIQETLPPIFGEDGLLKKDKGLKFELLVFYFGDFIVQKRLKNYQKLKKS
jgi:hypothetical protein